MDKFLEIYRFPRLSQEETDSLNRPITRSEVEFVTKNLPANKSPGPDGFTGEFHQTYKEKLIPILLRLFQKIEEEEHSQIHSTSPPLYWYQNKTKTLQKSYRPISLMNINY